LTDRKLNILVAPLDWGIGHATRCVPIIDYLIAQGHNVILASSGRALAFLSVTYPDKKKITINGYNISYAGKRHFMVLKILAQIPKIISAVYIEHKRLKSIIKANNIDLIISDNRYGLWHKDIPSVFITHQLMLKMPVGFSLFERIIHLALKRFIKKHNICWIPDYEGEENLSGDLSHKYKHLDNTAFIGPLTRFKNNNKETLQKKYDLLFLLSGPEPQRSIFEEKIISGLKGCELKTVIVRGMPGEKNDVSSSENIIFYEHLPTSDLQHLIKISHFVVCRSGYSTVMDLAALGAKAILIPTPGQTEQEYLANYLNQNGYFMTASQKDFTIRGIIEKAEKFEFKTFPLKAEQSLFENIQKITPSGLIKK